MAKKFIFFPFDIAWHPVICGWWEKHSFGQIPLSHLPKNGRIVADFETNEPLAAGFIYMTDSKMGWLEFIVTNPHSNPITRAKAVDALVEELVLLSKDLGIECLFTSTTRDSLSKTLQKHGFRVGDTDTKQLIRSA
jgi:hypothetical protein